MLKRSPPPPSSSTAASYRKRPKFDSNFTAHHHHQQQQQLYADPSAAYHLGSSYIPHYSVHYNASAAADPYPASYPSSYPATAYSQQSYSQQSYSEYAPRQPPRHQNQSSGSFPASGGHQHRSDPHASLGAPPANSPNALSRVLHVSNLSADLTIQELVSNVRGGMLESVRILPEKYCAFLRFVDHQGALLFFTHANVRHDRPFEIGGRQAYVHWAKANQPLSSSLAIAISQGCTRVLYFGGVSDPALFETVLSHDSLQREMSRFGMVESVSLVVEKACCFVYFCSISDCMKAFEAIRSDPMFQNIRISYGKDRCDRPIAGAKSSNNVFGATSNALASLGGQSSSSLTAASPLPPPVAPSRRVIYLGNITEDVTAEDICNSIRSGGPLYSISILHAKKCAFLTFIQAESAQIVYAAANTPMLNGGLVIKGKRVNRVMYAKDHFIPRIGQDALRQGASRNVYIGGIDLDLHTTSTLRDDFQQFGMIEQVHIIPDKRTAFINYHSVLEAHRALAYLKEPGSFEGRFEGCKMGYGRDRVACLPRNWEMIMKHPIALDNTPPTQEQHQHSQSGGGRDRNDARKDDRDRNARESASQRTLDISDEPLDIRQTVFGGHSPEPVETNFYEPAASQEVGDVSPRSPSHL